MSIKITTNQNTVTVADADKSITIINNNEPNRIDVVQPISNTIYVATLGPQGPQGPAGTGGGGSVNTSSLATTGSNIFVGNQIVSGNLIPAGPYTNNTSSYSLGSPTAAWQDLYVSNGSVFFISGATSASIKLSSGSVIFEGASVTLPTSSIITTAATASYYQETDPIFVAKSASLATTGSNNFNGNQTITGSLSQGLAGNIATGEYSHAEGSVTKAIGDYSHAEGDFTQATGNYSHAEGQNSMTLASAQYSHAEGNNTIAAANHQHVQGQWNITSSISAAFIVGNGTDNSNRSNLIYAHDSIVEITGSLSTTEFFTTTINETSLENFSSTSNYAGTVLNTRAIDGDVVLYDLVYLDTDGVWYQNNQATAASSLKLGIYLGNSLVLTEGHIVIDDNGSLGPDVQAPQLGTPIFIRDGSGTYMSTVSPSAGYVRILGHIYYQNQNTDSNLYIMRFNPSNDFYLLG